MSFTLPWRNVTRHKFRTYLIIAAITISVGLETGIVITIDSLYDDFIDRHRGENFTDITVHPKELATSNEIKSLSEELGAIKGLEKVSSVATFSIKKNSSNLERISPNIILFGMKPELHPDFPQLKLTSGECEISSGEVLISKTISGEILAMNCSLIFSADFDRNSLLFIESRFFFGISNIFINSS